MMSFYNDLYLFKKNLAIIDATDNYTYQDLIDISSNIPISNKEKTLTFILCDNNIESLVCYLSCLRGNSVPFLINVDIKQDLLSNLLNIYQPRYIWKPSLKKDEFIKLYSFKNYSLYPYQYSIDSKIHDDLKLLLTTSGSTGSSKLVRLSKLNIESNANAIKQYLCLTEKERPITTLPMSYTYGLSVINSHLAAGATILLTNKSLVTKDFWDFFRKNEATSLAGVPFSYELLNKLKFFSMNLPSLKTITQAGGKLPKYLIDAYTFFSLQKNVNFYIMYGQTEATARISYNLVNNFPSKKYSIGIPIPAGLLNIVDTNGEIISEPDNEGELIYRGSNVMMGYAENKKDLSKGSELNDILHTGDLAKFDKDGFFYITGRIKRFIKLRGIRTNLDEIEDFLQSKEIDCVVDGEDDKLYIAHTPMFSVDHINNELKNKYNFNNVSITFISLKEILHGDNGKILYNEIFKEIKNDNS
ncbi:MAG: AMP-binding protein [Clostridia bacterium]